MTYGKLARFLAIGGRVETVMSKAAPRRVLGVIWRDPDGVAVAEYRLSNATMQWRYATDGEFAGKWSAAQQEWNAMPREVRDAVLAMLGVNSLNTRR